jgi:hypothetical protein
VRKVSRHATPARTTAEARRVPDRSCDASVVGVETPRTISPRNAATPAPTWSRIAYAPTTERPTATASPAFSGVTSRFRRS